MRNQNQNITWKEYEAEIHAHFKEMFPKADISHNVKVTGCHSKVERQIDVPIEDYIAGSRM
jgi:hypothetical protein